MSRAWPVVAQSVLAELTFTPDTGALAAGDLVADTQELASVARLAGGIVYLQSITLLDQTDQKAELDVVFFRANQSMGTENNVPTISDANALDVVGVVTIVAGDYKDIGGASIAQIGNIGRMMKCAAGQTSLWVALVTRGTPTYGASALIAKFGFVRD